MRPIIPELLWIGNARDVRDVHATLSLGVRAIIDLAANESPVQYPRDIAYCRLPINDGPENDVAILRLAVLSTVEFARARVPTLVACSAGMSRSPAIVAATLALVEKQSADDVLLRIASDAPHDVAPALWADIKRIVDECSSSGGTGPTLTLLVLKTRQIDKLLEFYRAIGVELVKEQHGKGPVHYAGQLGATVFEIYPAKDAESVDSAARLGFRVARMTEIVESLRSSGTPIVSEPKSTDWGTRAVVRDPDSRAVELYQG